MRQVLGPCSQVLEVLGLEIEHSSHVVTNGAFIVATVMTEDNFHHVKMAFFDGLMRASRLGEALGAIVSGRSEELPMGPVEDNFGSGRYRFFHAF